MRQSEKTCPDCGLPYMPWPRVLFMMAIVFGGGLLGTCIAGSIAWLIYHHHRAVGLSLPPGLLIGGISSYWAFSKKFGPDNGWDYCNCSDSM